MISSLTYLSCIHAFLIEQAGSGDDVIIGTLTFGSIQDSRLEAGAPGAPHGTGADFEPKAQSIFSVRM